MTPILLVGEAYGEAEERLGQGFIGGSGAELLRMMDQAQLLRLDNTDRQLLRRYYSHTDTSATAQVWSRHAAEIHRTNVFQLRPPAPPSCPPGHRNDVKWFCTPERSAGLPGYPKLANAGYVRGEFEPELDRLADVVLEHNPNVIVCLGATSLWALAGHSAISKWRGTTLLSTHTVGDYKLLPTYHPAAVLYQYSLRPTVLADLMKARREAEFPDIRRPHREIWIEPTIEDVQEFISTHVRGCRLLSVDIETAGSRITCIGLAPKLELALVIPFDDTRAKGGCYWPTPEAERTVWKLLVAVLSDPSIPKLFHNGIFDIAFLWRSMRIKVLGATHDSMLLSHSLQPESLKSLGYLGSIHSDEAAWKHLGGHSKTIKRDN